MKFPQYDTSYNIRSDLRSGHVNMSTQQNARESNTTVTGITLHAAMGRPGPISTAEVISLSLISPSAVHEEHPSSAAEVISLSPH